MLNISMKESINYANDNEAYLCLELVRKWRNKKKKQQPLI